MIIGLEKKNHKFYIKRFGEKNHKFYDNWVGEKKSEVMIWWKIWEQIMINKDNLDKKKEFDIM